MARAKVLDDAVVRQLLKTPLAVQAFPFLRQPPKMASAPPCCGRKKGPPQPDLNRVKMGLAGLSETDRALLLRILGWTGARVIYSDGKKTVEVVF